MSLGLKPMQLWSLTARIALAKPAEGDKCLVEVRDALFGPTKKSKGGKPGMGGIVPQLKHSHAA